jgi:hypothetical protein
MTIAEKRMRFAQILRFAGLRPLTVDVADNGRAAVELPDEGSARLLVRLLRTACSEIAIVPPVQELGDDTYVVLATV